MESFCSHLILIYALLSAIILSFIGVFWIYAAMLARTAANRYYPGDDTL